MVGWKIGKVRREERLASYVGFFADVVIACYAGRLFALYASDWAVWRESDGKCQESYADVEKKKQNRLFLTRRPWGERRARGRRVHRRLPLP